jgi:hypothetical protein
MVTEKVAMMGNKNMISNLMAKAMAKNEGAVAMEKLGSVAVLDKCYS